MKIFYTALLCFLLTCLALHGYAYSENCYLAKDGFAVEQPFMVTKGCFLFHHGANVDLDNESEMIITREEELHPDPIHSEFLRFILERKLVKLKKGTLVFSCAYDLQTIARDYKLSGNQSGATRTLGYELPQFNCSGVTSMWTPIRPVHESHCFWVAVPLIRCEEFSSELNPMDVTDPNTEE